VKVYTIYFNEFKDADKIKIIDKAIALSRKSKSEFGFKALVKEAKRVIKDSEKK
jgi:uncharacterized protein (DUF1778 family)